MNQIGSFFSSVIGRLQNKNTTVGGGVAGLVLVAIIGKIEEMSGCKFAVAFANIDWVQIVGFASMQIFGAMTTDANKTTSTHNTVKGDT
jgi:hypothetical protein